MKTQNKVPQKPGNWKRVGTGMFLRKDGKTYAVYPKKPELVYEAICRFPNTEREYYDFKPVVGVDLTRELEEWKRAFSKS
jgi:hypothetical protein